jgi:hypothetical protein
MVVHGVDGTPVAGVRVTLVKRVPTGQYILNEDTVTDDRGTFVLRAPSVGEYSLEAYQAPNAFGEYGKDPFLVPVAGFQCQGGLRGSSSGFGASLTSLGQCLTRIRSPWQE